MILVSIPVFIIIMAVLLLGNRLVAHNESRTTKGMKEQLEEQWRDDELPGNSSGES
jgi:hypothetical protein